MHAFLQEMLQNFVCAFILYNYVTVYCCGYSNLAVPTGAMKLDRDWCM